MDVGNKRNGGSSGFVAHAGDLTLISEIGVDGVGGKLSDCNTDNLVEGTHGLYCDSGVVSDDDGVFDGVIHLVSLEGISVLVGDIDFHAVAVKDLLSHVDVGGIEFRIIVGISERILGAPVLALVSNKLLDEPDIIVVDHVVVVRVSINKKTAVGKIRHCDRFLSVVFSKEVHTGTSGRHNGNNGYNCDQFYVHVTIGVYIQD